MYFLGIEAMLRTNQPLKYSHARFAHAAILQLITRHDTKLGALIHNQNTEKRLTIAILPHTGSSAVLRITFLSEYGPALSECIANEWIRDGKIRLADVECEIESFKPRSKSWNGVLAWNDLLSCQSGPNIRISFLTPTTIMKTDHSGKRYSELQPRASDIFRSLQRRWIQFGGPEMAIDLDTYIRRDQSYRDDLSECIPANIQIWSEEVDMGKYLLLGIRGNVSYRVHTDDLALKRTIAALAMFARYSGVGYHTMQGMGAVHTELYNDKNDFGTSTQPNGKAVDGGL